MILSSLLVTNLAILEVFVSQPELKTEDRGEQRQVAVLNKISSKLFIFPRINFIRQYFQIHQNCEHFILMPTCPQLLFGVLSENFGLYILQKKTKKYSSQNFYSILYTVSLNIKIAKGQRGQPFTIHNENPY